MTGQIYLTRLTRRLFSRYSCVVTIAFWAVSAVVFAVLAVAVDYVSPTTLVLRPRDVGVGAAIWAVLVWFATTTRWRRRIRRSARVALELFSALSCC